MNRVHRLSWTAVLLFTACVAFAQSPASQSLGDYARAVKKTKNAPASDHKKVYDNDNLPANSSISVVGNTTSSQQPSSDQSPSSAAAADPIARPRQPGAVPQHLGCAAGEVSFRAVVQILVFRCRPHGRDGACHERGHS